MSDDNNNSDQIVLFADFDSANMARYEKVLTNKPVNNENANKNGYTITANNIAGEANGLCFSFFTFITIFNFVI